MAGEQTTALVLRTVEFSETSLVVTLLSKEFGRLSTLAKGARRPKGPFEGSLDLLCVCRVVVIRKNTESLDLLTEAKLIRRFRAGTRSLERLYAGYYLAEMLRLLLTDDRDPHPKVYDLALQALDKIDGDGKLEPTLLYFDVQLLRLLGHAPSTDKCIECGNRVIPTNRVSFALLGGGVVCDPCRQRQVQTVSITRNSLETLKLLHDSESTNAIEISPAVYGELRAVLNRYITLMLGKMPRMQSFLPAAINT